MKCVIANVLLAAGFIGAIAYTFWIGGANSFLEAIPFLGPIGIVFYVFWARGGTWFAANHDYYRTTKMMTVFQRHNDFLDRMDASCLRFQRWLVEKVRRK
ncbi:MAG TPA: hypothetical protein VGA65_02120 [Hyphomicrobium sp.]|jgi:hypothetical protein